MIQLSDGTWRVIGAGSRLHPESPSQEPGNDCGFGAVYSTYAHLIDWIEDESGYDVSPCHDADGTWNPNFRCDAFPEDPGNPVGTQTTWNIGCVTNSNLGTG